MDDRRKNIPSMALCLFIAVLLLIGTASAAAPEAAFGGTPTSGVIPLTVNFTDQSTGDPDGRAWFFGDETYGEAWTEQTGNAGWSERYSHTTVAMPNGSIVLMGGGKIGVPSLYENDTWVSHDYGTTWTLVNASSGWGARLDHTAVVIGDSIVLMGGKSGATFLNDTWVSHDCGATWEEVNGSSGWSARYCHTSVALPDGSILLIGGSNGTYLNDTWVSHDYGTTWEEVNGSSGWSARSSSRAVAIDNNIVLIGGVDGARRNDVWRSTDGGATWTLATEHAGWEARSGHTVAAMPDGSIVLMGGGDAYPYKNDVWRSTDGGAAWTQLPNGGWSARIYHTSVAMPDGSVILTGGFDGTYLNDVWRLDPVGSTEQNPSHIYTATGTYTVALQAYNDDGYNSTREINYITVEAPVAPTAAFSADLTSGPAPLTVQFTDSSTDIPTGWAWFFGDETYEEPWTQVNESAGWPGRYVYTAVTMPDGSILLMGGHGDTYLHDVWRSTDGGATWTLATGNAGWSARMGHTSVVLPDGSIVLMGGHHGPSLNDTWRSTDGGVHWDLLPNTGWPARDGHTSVVLPDESIVLMGGSNSTTRFNDVWRSTDYGATWTRVDESADWSGRFGHTAVVLPDGSVVLIGGKSGSAYMYDVWRFDPVGSSEQNPTHEYAASGTYSVALQAYNVAGYGSTREINYITVTSSDVLTAAFSGTPTSGTAPLIVSFTDASTGSPMAWNWSFGDGEWFNTTSAAEKNPTHAYTATGAYTVNLTVGNLGGADTHSEAGYITVTAPTPTPTPGPIHDSGGDSPTVTPVQTPTTVEVSVGGNSPVSKVSVTGTGIGRLTVTGTVQSLPGIVYEYFSLVPVRYTTITAATITFSVPAAWLEEHGLSAEDIVLYRHDGATWTALPTTVGATENGQVTFTATSSGFSLFAITGIEKAGKTTTPTAAATTSRAVAEPTAEQTTAAPAGEPAPDFPLGTVALAGGAVLVLIGAGFLVRRWWIRRQNPALFRDYD